MSERLNHYQFWFDPPPEPSPKMAKHVRKIQAGWRPNARICGDGRDACSSFYDVYQYEWYVLMAIMFGGEYLSMLNGWEPWLAEHFPEVLARASGVPSPETEET